MSFQLRPLAMCLVFGGAVFLSACGGGSSGSDAGTDQGGSTEHTGDNNNGNSNGGGVSTEAIDRYVGTFATACAVDGDGVTLTSDNQAVNVVHSYTFTKVSANQAHLERRATYYAPSDNTCQGGSVGTVTWKNASNMATLGDAVQVDLEGQTVDAHRVGIQIGAADSFVAPGVNVSAVGGISAGGTVVLGSLRFVGHFFTDTQGWHDLMAVGANGGRLYMGDATSVDASGYPTKLNTSAYRTRQP